MPRNSRSGKTTHTRRACQGPTQPTRGDGSQRPHVDLSYHPLVVEAGRYRETVYLVGRRVGLSHEDAEDNTQEVMASFVCTYVKRANFVRNVRTTLERMARNAARRTGGRSARRAYHSLDIAFGNGGPMDHRPSATEYGSDEMQRLEEEIQRLPECEHELLSLKLQNPEATFEQLGEMLGVSHDTAWRRYHSALALLRQRLGRAQSEPQ
jgi:RNA polymerase sigma factor (sigma-70 family)